MESSFELRNALLIHNPNAGGGGEARRKELDVARKIFATGGIEADLAETTGPGHATEIALRAGNEGRQLVIACGGDASKTAIAFRSPFFPAAPQTSSRKNSVFPGIFRRLRSASCAEPFAKSPSVLPLPSTSRKKPAIFSVSLAPAPTAASHTPSISS